MLLNALILITAISFYWYGFSCLFNKKLFLEFERFGLSKYRKLTGMLQLLGATSLLIGFLYPILTLLASAGLAVLMFLGLIVRIKIKDGILVSVPAFAFLLVNLFIFVAAYQNI